MNINHVAIWADNLELLRSFYTEYFGGCCGSRYHNPTKGFTSYIVAFDGGARLELMHKDGLSRPLEPHLGFAHISFSVGDKESVDSLTARLRRDGYVIVDGPRVTGDGFYESAVEDPEGNIVEITVCAYCRLVLLRLSMCRRVVANALLRPGDSTCSVSSSRCSSNSDISSG